MYLRLPTSEAIERNQLEATKRGCSGTTDQWWAWSEYEDDTIRYLHVLDGDGLSPEEIAECVDNLPPSPPPLFDIDS
tara:strand:+ start:357 stop:587 length:231 start_codon:yes stop_codon:yes gene_type:complete